MAGRVRAGQLPSVDEAVEFLQGLLTGVGHMHEQQTVHRDIKPANIALHGGDWSRPVLLDLGLARGAGEATITAYPSLLGTPAYMAPEQLQCQPARQASDLFAAGVTVRELLGGRHPFYDPGRLPARRHGRQDRQGTLPAPGRRARQCDRAAGPADRGKDQRPGQRPQQPQAARRGRAGRVSRRAAEEDFLIGDELFGDEERDDTSEPEEAAEGIGRAAARLADGSGFLITDGPGAGSITDDSAGPDIRDAPPLPGRDKALDGTIPLFIVHRAYRYFDAVPRLLAQFHTATGGNLALGVSSFQHAASPIPTRASVSPARRRRSASSTPRASSPTRRTSG